MNVEGEQNASASAPASPTTASTAAVQQAPQITSFFQLERTSPTPATPATSPPAAADLPAAAAGTNMTAPASPHQQRLNSTRSFSVSPPSTTCGCSEVITPPGLSHPLIYHTPKHTLWVFGRALSHPLVYHTPTFITPPNVPCGWSDVLSHPLVYHTPWGPPRPALYHRGYTTYHTPHRIPHPVIIFSSAQMYHRGCVILCSLR